MTTDPAGNKVSPGPRERRLQALADEFNSNKWEDVGERGNPLRSALTASDEVLHELLDKCEREHPGMGPALGVVYSVRAALMPRTKERSELGREK